MYSCQQVLTIILLIPNLHLSMTTKTSPSTQQLLQSRQISVEANRFLHYNIQPSDVEILYICFVNIYQLLTHCDLGGSTSWLVDILLERILCMYSHCILAIYLDVKFISVMNTTCFFFFISLHPWGNRESCTF